MPMITRAFFARAGFRHAELPSYAIELRAHDPAWADAAVREIVRLREALGTAKLSNSNRAAKHKQPEGSEQRGCQSDGNACA